MEDKPKYACPHCGLRHRDRGALARHVVKHDPPGGFRCSICEAQFTTEKARQAHKQEAHVVHRCLLCTSEFTDKKELRDHVKSKHAGTMQKPQEICDACGSQFRTKTQLSNHVTSKCGTEKRFKCETCNRCYQTNASLKSHKLSHMKGKAELCGFCGASFVNRGQLKIHERVHTGEKPYKCDKCDKAFGYRESLITHSTIHTGVKPFFCQCCDARFSCVGNLIKHRKLRPKTCGLPQYNPINRVAPRPTKKTMPSLTDRKSVSNIQETLDDPLKINMDQHNVGDCGSEIDSKTSDQSSILYVNNLDHDAKEEDDDDNLVDENNHDVEYETVELLDKPSEYITGDGYEQIIERDREICEIIDRDRVSDYAASEGDQEIDTKETKCSVQNGLSAQESHVQCSQDNVVDCEPVPPVDSNREGKRVEILQIQFVGDVASSEDERITEEDCSDKDALEFESESRSNQIDMFTEPALLLAFLQQEELPELHMEALNEMFKDEDGKKLREQLEIVRQNCVATSNLFACKSCPLQYTTAYFMTRHLERIHSFQLDKARGKLQFVKRTVHEKRFRCKYCTLSYVNASRLKSHIANHGTDGRLRHKCSVCVRYFETEDMARQHAREQHREQLVCDSCEKEFKEPDALQQHVRYAHKGMKELRKRRYMCHRCGKHFITRNTMSDHERANCGQSPIYRCETCGKHYASFASLQVHRTMHQNLLPYECEVCHKRFRVKGQLKVHERSHTGEKPFRCEHCPKSFPYRESLLVHQTSHTGIKRFACSGCAQMFSCIANLQSHRRFHQATCGAVPNDTKPLQKQ